jgi:hypothetical protein
MTSTAVAIAPPLVSVPRLWPGETAVIIGGGSSLTPENVAFCRGKAKVIAVKGAFLLAPWADVLYAGDAKWWRGYRGAQEFTGLKYTIEQDPKEEQLGDWPGVQVLRNTGTDGLELAPTGLRTGYNSGFQAIGLAVHFGVSRVILLGFDMWCGPQGHQNWFDTFPHLVKSHHVQSPYPLFIQAFTSLVEPLKNARVEVVNATRWTMLTAFPYLDLEEALKK